MTNPRRASIGVPTVNRFEFLRDALMSLTFQAYRDFEVVLADNSGDSDYNKRVDSLVEEFSEKLEIRLLRHPVKLDLMDNFNSMVDHARGEFWACLPDDDRFCPEFLALSIAALDRHPECAFTFADHWLMTADGRRDESGSASNSSRYRRTSLREGVYWHPSIMQLVLDQSICLQTMLFRRSVIGSLRFTPKIMSADLSLFVRIGASREPLHAYYIAQRLFEYRIHGAQVTSVTNRKEVLRSQIASFELVDEVPASYRDAYMAKLARNYLALAVLEAETGDLASARKNAARAVRLSPRLGNIIGATVVSVAPSSLGKLRRIRELLS